MSELEFIGEDPEEVVEAEPDPTKPTDIVRMYLPAAKGGYADVTRRAYDEVWSDKGWTLNPPQQESDQQQEEEI